MGKYSLSTEARQQVNDFYRSVRQGLWDIDLNGWETESDEARCWRVGAKHTRPNAFLRLPDGTLRREGRRLTHVMEDDGGFRPTYYYMRLPRYTEMTEEEIDD